MKNRKTGRIDWKICVVVITLVAITAFGFGEFWFNLLLLDNWGNALAWLTPSFAALYALYYLGNTSQPTEDC